MTVEHARSVFIEPLAHAHDIIHRISNPRRRALRSATTAGGAYAELGDPLRAVDDLSRAIDLDPRLPEAYHNRGAAYRDLGELDRPSRTSTRPSNSNRSTVERQRKWDTRGGRKTRRVWRLGCSGWRSRALGRECGRCVSCWVRWQGRGFGDSCN